MHGEVLHRNIAGRLLRFRNPAGLYPVNRYQSLVLATTSEIAALTIAARKGCRISGLSAWEPCCGGGPAAVSLKSLGLKRVHATDINEDALAACRANAALNDLALDHVRPANLLEDGDSARFDLIACNPPCGAGRAVDDRISDPMEIATTGGQTGMEFTCRLLERISERLSPGGSFLFVAVSTGDIRALAAFLDEKFGGCWRTFPATPVAAPWTPVNGNQTRASLEAALGFKPMIWERGDGWYWRLSWIVEVTPDGALPSGFALSPYGFEIANDPAAAAMITELGEEGFPLA